jgi:hypothetical protein
MICDDAAEYISALYDGKTIPPGAAQHFATCPDCQARLSDYLAMGIELRRTASLELADAVPSRSWTKPHNHVGTWWQKGWVAMRIPRFAFAGLIAGIMVLASALAVNKGRGQNSGTVVLLSTAGPNGPIADCPLPTQDKNQPTCSWYGKIGSRFVAYKIRLLSRDGSRVLLSTRTRTSTHREALSFESDLGHANEARFEPGKPLNLDVPDVGTLTLKGEWLDHMPILGTLDPGPNEVRFSAPLLVKDKAVVGDFSGHIGIFSQDEQDRAMAFYIPGEGRFLISQLPMRGAVEARVALGRISFEEGGHSWEFVNGVPVCRADHIWVLHQPNFRMKIMGQNGDHVAVGDVRLVQAASGVWLPEEPTGRSSPQPSRGPSAAEVSFRSSRRLSDSFRWFSLAPLHRRWLGPATRVRAVARREGLSLTIAPPCKIRASMLAAMMIRA